MKLKYILLFGAVVAFSSCSTAYRSAQTPDDVYYSPAPVQSGYVNADKSDEGRDSYYYPDEESQIRRGIQNPVYRTPVTVSLGYGYGYNPYGYNSFYNPYYYGGYNPVAYMGFYNPYMPMAYGGWGYGFNSFYSPYNSFYGPYYNSYYGGSYGHSYYPGNITTTTNAGPRRYNLNPYINNKTRSSVLPGNTNTSPTTSTAPVRRTTGVGDAIRRVVSPNRERNTYVTPNNNSNNQTRNNNNNNNNTYNQRPERTFNNAPQVNSAPSVRTPSSSPSSSGGSAPVRSFGR